MNISPNGLALVKEFEGYLQPLPDGSCTTYYCPAGKLTLGWGCTEGIKPGDVWTVDQAEAALLRELSKHEKAVQQSVTVPLNQNQFDALTSFSFNLGTGNLRSSTLLKKLNKGDYPGAQAQFLEWNKHEDPKTKKKIVSRGLSTRRAKEAALFASRTEEEGAGSPMPQAVAAPKEPLIPAKVREWGAWLTSGSAFTGLGLTQTDVGSGVKAMATAHNMPILLGVLFLGYVGFEGIKRFSR
jgi:lysozyme